MLFVKGFIIGLGKIIPGVSGAILAIILNVYDRLLDSLTSFFSDWKNNLRFLVTLSLGGILAILLGSKVIFFLLRRYYFFTMMFFIGLILSGTYHFGKNIRFNLLKIIVILFIVVIFAYGNTVSVDISNSFSYKTIYFLGGYISIFASIVPGISSTALLMMLGIYDNIIGLLAGEIVYDISNISYYLLGMFLSFIINIYIVDYVIKKYHDTSYTIILGLTIGSIISLFNLTFNSVITSKMLAVGIVFLILGIGVVNLINKSVK